MQIMGETVEKIIRYILKQFPKLIDDNGFKVTSKATPNYNCISWACVYTDRWIQPSYIGRPSLDCVVWWPPDVVEGMGPECLIKLFEYHGYVECDSCFHETGYRKVALYYNEMKNEWTHAARELKNGLWTSKLGSSIDMQHGTPESIECDSYGKIFCYMKKKTE